MARSLAQKKALKKKKGQAYGTTATRNNGYSRGRAFIPGKQPRERIAATMLLRNAPPNRLVRVEVDAWQRVPDLSTPDETLTATAVFADGRTVCRETTVLYRKGEREKILEAMLSGKEPPDALVRAADAIRKTRWKRKEQLIAAVRAEFAGGLA